MKETNLKERDVRLKSEANSRVYRAKQELAGIHICEVSVVIFKVEGGWLMYKLNYSGCIVPVMISPQEVIRIKKKRN